MAEIQETKANSYPNRGETQQNCFRTCSGEVYSTWINSFNIKLLLDRDPDYSKSFSSKSL